MLVAIQRDLFALGAMLADPRHRIAARVDEGHARRRRRRRASRRAIDALEAELPPLRRFILAGRLGGRRDAAPRAHRLPPRRARAIVALGADAVDPASRSPTSTGCPICSSSWRARSTPAPAPPRSSGNRRRVRHGACTWRASTTRTFPVASRLLPQAARPHVAAIYAFARARRRLRRRRRAHRRGSGSRCSTTGSAGCTTRRPAACRTTDSDAGAHLHRRSADTMRRCELDVAALRRSPQRVSSGRARRRATTPGTTCSTTAGDRPIPSAGSCCASSGYRDDRARRDVRRVCTALQLTNFWQDLARDWREGPALRAAGGRPRAPAPTSAISAARRISREWRPRSPTRGGRDAGAVRRGPAARRRRQRPAALGAARDLARRHAHPRSARSGRLRRVPSTARARLARRGPRSAGARSSGADAGRDAQDQLLLLVSLAAARRSARPSSPSSISAAPSTTASIWRPIRRAPDRRRRAGAREIARVFDGGAPETPEGRAAPAVRRAVPSAARAVRRARRRRRDGRRRRAATQTFADLEPYCHRVASSVGLICAEIFGYREPARARLRARSRRRAAAHEHPARRRRGLPARAAVSAARGSRAVRLHRGRRRARGRARPAAACSPPQVRAVLEHQAARARVFFARAVRALPHDDARRSSPAEIMRAIYWELLRRIEAAGLRRVQPRHPRAAGRPRRDSRFRRGAHLRRAECSAHDVVVVIGAGFAGLSAAVRLADAGREVVVVEEAPRLGGRATAFTDRETGERVDNGQHVLFGCYRETYAFLRRHRHGRCWRRCSRGFA